jgi:putative hemolysin
MDWSALSELLPRLLAMVGLLLLSAYFSGSETSLFSLTRAQREKLERSPSANDRFIVTLLRDPRRLIVTILLGNELVNISFAALMASAAERVFSAWGQIAVTLAATLFAVPVLLLFGEITPKSIAMRVAESWARATARPLGVLSILLTPARLVVSGVAAVIVRLLGGKSQPPPPRAIGEAELKALVDASTKEGSLEQTERNLILKVFAFRDRNIGQIMTPARNVFSLSFDLPLVRLAAEAAKSGFSRIPIYRGKRDHIVGILYTKDLVGLPYGRLTGRTVKDVVRQPFYVPKAAKCDRIFRELKKNGTHIALVVDEYGRLSGLVTMDDLLEELFGEVKDEKRRRQAAALAGTPVLETGEVVKVEPEPAPPADPPPPEKAGGGAG